MTTIYNALHDDHEKIKSLLEELVDTTERATKTRKEKFLKLKKLVKAHSEAEEDVFYNPLEDKKETHDEILESEEEHELVDHLLSEIEKTDTSSEEWLAKMKVLKENLEHHIEEEEGETFDKAKDIFSNSEAQKMGDKFEKEKKQKLKVA